MNLCEPLDYAAVTTSGHGELLNKGHYRFYIGDQVLALPCSDPVQVLLTKELDIRIGEKERVYVDGFPIIDLRWRLSQKENYAYWATHVLLVDYCFGAFGLACSNVAFYPPGTDAKVMKLPAIMLTEKAFIGGILVEPHQLSLQLDCERLYQIAFANI